MRPILSSEKISLSILLLIIGGCIYLLMRPPLLLIHKVAWDLGFGIIVQHGRMFVAGWAVPNWFLYSLPGALWATAYILIIDAILSENSVQSRLLIAAFIPALGVGSELMQWAGLLPGTFDAIDMVFYAFPFLIYVIIEMMKSHENVNVNATLFTLSFFTLYYGIQ